MNTDNSNTYTGSAGASSSTGAGGTAASLKDDARQLKDTAKARLADEADSRKGQVAQGMKQVSSALDAARSDLDDSDTPDWLKSGLRRVASSVSSFADELESKDSGQLASDVRSFARDRPSIFLGACAAAGFAAARVFSAGTGSSTSGSSSSGGTRSRTDRSGGRTGAPSDRGIAPGQPYGQTASGTASPSVAATGGTMSGTTTTGTSGGVS